MVKNDQPIALAPFGRDRNRLHRQCSDRRVLQYYIGTLLQRIVILPTQSLPLFGPHSELQHRRQQRGDFFAEFIELGDQLGKRA